MLSALSLVLHKGHHAQTVCQVYFTHLRAERWNEWLLYPTTAEAEALKKKQQCVDENLADGKVENQRYANWVYCSKRREKCSYYGSAKKSFKVKVFCSSWRFNSWDPGRRSGQQKSDVTWLAELFRREKAEKGGPEVRAQNEDDLKIRDVTTHRSGGGNPNFLRLDFFWLFLNGEMMRR